MADRRKVDAGWGTAFSVILAVVAVWIAALMAAGGLGAPEHWLMWVGLGVPILGYVLLAVLTRSRLVSDHLVAGRAVPSAANGLATGAQWATGAVFFGFAGAFFAGGAASIAYPLGWTAGFVLISVLMAPFLHKSGAVTVPDFFEKRYGGVMPRLLGALIVLVVCLVFLIAQMQAVGLIAQWVIAPELPWFGYAGGVWLAAALVVICAIPGGMLSVTWTQIAQGVLILIGFVVPAVWISTVGTGMPLPSLALSEPMGVIANLDAALGTAETHGAVLRGWAVGETGPVSILALLACVMIGTASLPQLLVRGMTTPTVRGARLSMGWSLVFVTAVVLTIPAYALFAKAGLLGLFASDGVLAYDAIPGWMLHWSGVGGDLLTICGAPVGDAVTAQGLCGPERAGGITYGDLVFRSEFLVLALPELAAMPVAILVLLVAGGFAAALSSATGLAQTLANSLGHDVVRGMMAPEMGPRQRVTTIKALVVAIVLIAGNIALVPPSDLAVMLAWALSLAGAGLFAALALGIWDRRTTGAGAAAGMVIGFGLTLLYIVVATFGPDLVRDTGDEASWFGIGSEAAGAFGIPAALVTTWLVSRLTPAPDDEIEDFIEDMRIPRDHAIAPTR